MVGVDLVIYSDRKVALELDLTEGKLYLPSFETPKTSKKALLGAVNNKLSINAEDYIILKDGLKSKNPSLCLLIGEWEGLLKTKNASKRFIWHPLKEAIRQLDLDEHKRIVEELRKSYREVVSKNNENIGIASVEECEKFNLARKAAIVFLENEKKEIMFRAEKTGHSSLFSSQMLGESPEEASYRLLGEEFGLTTELKQLRLVTEYNQKNRLNMAIVAGNYDQTLTFFIKEAKKPLFLAKNDVLTAIKSEDNPYSPEFTRAFMEYISLKP
jgi:hypothetical protein